MHDAPNYREVRTADIFVPERRRPLSDAAVSSLAESIRGSGLLQPIVVTDDEIPVLVAGLHRLMACRRLGWATIPATVRALPELDRELAEIDENLIRNELTVLERAEHFQRRQEIYEARHPEVKRGAAGGAATAAKAKRNDFALPLPTPAPVVAAEPPAPTFADDTATKVGVTPRTVQHEVQIAKKIDAGVRADIRDVPGLADNKTELLRIARLKPAEQRDVVDKLKSGAAKNVRAAKNRTVADRIAAEPPPVPTGPYRVIAIDPPWPYEKRSGDATHRAGLPYPPMDIAAICALPVADLACDDAVLWLWTTNAFMRDAYRCLDAWGFTDKTILTWVKDRMGTGDWLRGKTEHAILAARGRPTVTLTNQTTALVAPLREHSRKPDEFYALVESLCPGSKLEMFAREPRDGWVRWGAETEKFGG